jgi:dihydrofolate reductase
MTSPSRPRLVAIVAMASNRVIGSDGQLPWHLPEDLRFFKKTTLGHPILMGRRTHESIGRALPGRRNIVLSSTMPVTDGIEVIRDIAELAGEPGQTIFVIGGAEVFRHLLPDCEGLYLTHIARPYDGNVLLPEFEHLFGPAEVIGQGQGIEFRYYTRQRCGGVSAV